MTAPRKRVKPERRCGGTYYNGPDKRWARCSICRTLDYEANEGDRCDRPAPTKPARRWNT